jgi:hypothetical protein
VLAGLPSATEVFAEMRDEMRRAGTRNLLVDLGQNDGGSSVLSSILVWTLYGREAALDARSGSTEIVKYSPEAFAAFPSPTLAELNAGRPFPLTEDDYDLTQDRGRRAREEEAEELDRLARRMPTFASAWNAEPAASPYPPSRVMVLCDAATYSAALTVLVHLQRAGAEVVGIPSAQAGNCFGDVLELELPHSGVRYQLSRKYFELFPGDAETGRTLMPDHVATWETLASYGFDPLALIRFAGDLLDRGETAGGSPDTDPAG